MYTSILQTILIVIFLGTCSVKSQKDNSFPCFSNRLVNGTELKYTSLKQFTRDMCSQCYAFVPREFKVLTDYNDTTRNVISKVPSLAYYIRSNTGFLCRPRATSLPPDPCYVADPETMNVANPEKDNILQTFSSKFHRETFLKCCNEAVKCCNRTLTRQESELAEASNTSSSSSFSTNELYCPAKWDGWDCFERVKAGTTVQQVCPVNALQSLKRQIPECVRGQSIKTCDENGSWHRLKISGQFVEKTNYVYCSFVGRNKSLHEIKLRVSLHSLTLVSLIGASSIFIAYKQYCKTRIRLHLNFFLSLALHSLSDILLQILIRQNHLENTSYNIFSESPSWCILLTVFVKTSKLTNYCWMLAEGLYLYKLIVYAFKEQTRIIHFYLVGWLLPVVTMIPYIAVHWTLEEHNDKCWHESMGELEWIYNIVPLFCLSANCILLGNILFVLFKKLRSSPAHFKTALRATLILVPVFGVHYMFYVTRGIIVEKCDSFSNFLFFLSAVLDCLQGTFVSIIFCFVNSEVHSFVRRTIRRRFYSTDVVTEEHDLKSISNSQHSQRGSNLQVHPSPSMSSMRALLQNSSAST